MTGDERRARLARARLCLVAGPETGGASWWEATQAALATGLLDVLQLRDKSADDPTFLRLALRAREATASQGVLLLLNDRVALAALADADGAHVGADDLSPGLARLLLGPDRLLGLSTHDEAEVVGARRLPVDYLGLGPCFATDSKSLERPPGGAALVRRCVALAEPPPLWPIGGITPQNAGALLEAGALRLAVGSSVLRASSPADATRALHDVLRRAPSTGS